MTIVFRCMAVLVFLLTTCQSALFAQQDQVVDDRVLVDVKDGIRFSKDSLFLLNMRFRMQNRLGYTTLSGADLNAAYVDARVRRLRLRFDGFVLNKNIRYYLQLSFARADLDLDAGTVAQPVRDAMVFYHFNEHFYIGFGQGKLPGNRQRVVSSGNLQFPDRSVANAFYTLDRDFGLFAYYKATIAEQVIMVKGAFTSGDGRGMPPSNSGMAYTGRLEWQPLGKFANGGDYSEGDLEFEPVPKLSLAAGYCYNQRAIRTGGQLGPELFAPRDMGTFIADMLLKHRGWALSAEYFDRSSPDPVSLSDEGVLRAIQVGQGFNGQLSKLFRNKFELAGRYSIVAPEAEELGQGPLVEEALLGTTKYLHGHRIKLQLYVGYRWLQHQVALDVKGSAWTTMFQVEFGI